VFAERQLFVREEGHGPRVLLLHGGMLTGDLNWREQLPLAERWTLLIVDRAGYGRSRISDGEDVELDGELAAELLGDGAHLVGQSSGAVAALLAAGRRPEAVLSLTLSEPPVFQLVPDSADARRIITAFDAHFRSGVDDEEWMREFVRIVSGPDAQVPDQVPPPLLESVRVVRRARRLPWDVELPIAELAAASFPKLLISGDHSAAFEAVCDALAARIGAERQHVVGARHVTPLVGAAFNRALEGFMRGR
jgi:pimeloyl-ACP methyl ester carboxylesterase